MECILETRERNSHLNSCDESLVDKIIIPEKLRTIGQIDVVEMELESSKKHRYLFVYQDLSTGFVVLKALVTNAATIVASELLDILTIIGVPRIIQSTNGRDFAKQVVQELYLLWEGLKILSGDVTESVKTERNFKAQLKSWLARNPSRSWVDGVKNVQIAENVTHVWKNGKVPYEHLFGESWRMVTRNLSRHKVSPTHGLISVRTKNVSPLDEMIEEKQENLLDDGVNTATEARTEEILKEPLEIKSRSENAVLSCKVCQKEYTKPGHLKNHEETHLTKTRYDCEICFKAFRVRSLYEKHKSRFHAQPGIENSSSVTPQLKATSKRRKTEDSSLECSYCKQKFNFPSVLKRHVRSHTNERPYICEVCSKSFKQLGHLSQHMLTHTDFRSLQCSFCGEKFETLDMLKTHSISAHNHQGTIGRLREAYRLFECDSCKKVFSTKSVLERHIFTHTHERQFGCEICGKKFKQAGHVKSHMLVHTGEKKFQCNICSKRFSLSNSLKKHMYVHNGEKPHQCNICGSRFLERRNLKGHLLTHTNERPFSCKVCGKRYTLADTLKRHVSAAHEHGRIFQCEVCAKMFKQLAHLSVHKKVHNDERPFQCHLCEKNFKHKNVLKSHLAIHANLRPFECNECKATFVRKTNLQTHITSAHMNERPYACKICNKRFKQVSHLNGHVVVHSNSMPFQCDFCERRCNRLDNLKKHMRLHTKNKTSLPE